jgi:hypothetical protein
MPFDPNSSENNRNLQAAGFKAHPSAVAVGGVVGTPMPNGLTSMVPMKKVATAVGEQLGVADPNLSGGLKMARTKYGSK